jgi:hypothetical protein
MQFDSSKIARTVALCSHIDQHQSSLDKKKSIMPKKAA